jgi:Phosphatidylethanolamine-binding protein
MGPQVSQQEMIPGVASQDTNDKGEIGYTDPRPLSATLRYVVRLFALDSRLSLEPEATHDELKNAIHGHVLAEAELIDLSQEIREGGWGDDVGLSVLKTAASCGGKPPATVTALTEKMLGIPAVKRSKAHRSCGKPRSRRSRSFSRCCGRTPSSGL